MGGKPLFAEDDPRLQFTVSDVDPRIHFALVCGAKVVLNYCYMPGHKMLVIFTVEYMARLIKRL